MLKIGQDESIHSLIYRTHIVNGDSNFSNIITLNGRWTSFPNILKGTLHYYEPVNDSFFLRLLRELGQVAKSDQLFKYPTQDQAYLKRFFSLYSGLSKAKDHSSTINYCIECVREHIKNFGYAVLKVTWLTNTFCNEHNTSLFQIPESNRAGSVKALKSVYLGIHPKNYCTPKYVNKVSTDFRQQYIGTDTKYVAPCLNDEFKTFILKTRYDLPVEISKKAGVKLSHYRTSDNSLIRIFIMEKIYYALKNTQNQLFKEFWSKYAVTKKVNTGVISKKSLVETIIISKKSDCQRCEYLDCSANLLIIKTRQKRNLSRECEQSMQHILYRAYDQGLINLDQYTKHCSQLGNTKRKRYMGLGVHREIFENLLATSL